MTVALLFIINLNRRCSLRFVAATHNFITITIPPALKHIITTRRLCTITESVDMLLIRCHPGARSAQESFSSDNNHLLLVS